MNNNRQVQLNPQPVEIQRVPRRVWFRGQNGPANHQNRQQQLLEECDYFAGGDYQCTARRCRLLTLQRQVDSIRLRLHGNMY